jgi:signal peptidase I
MAIPRSLVDGRSMQPTFENEERLIVSRVNYLITLPERGDIIVFNSISRFESDVMLIKRIIGLPGDRVEFRERQLYLNGIPIEEPYTLEECNSRCSDEEWILSSGEYFVMGDNRNNSSDSRRFGPIPLGQIVGRVVFRYWPPERVGLITHQNYPELEAR